MVATHWRARAALLLANRRDNPVIRLGGRVARGYWRSINNWNYDPATNGEEALIQRLAPTLNRVFDVGANVGDWSAAVRKASPHAELHAFELIPATAQALRQRLPPAVTVNAFGLGSAAGSFEVDYYPEASWRSNSLGGDVDEAGRRLSPQRVMAEIQAGDAYCSERAIDHIDLLKIDVEGTEFAVLEGFSDLVSRRAISVIQFEYGQFTGLARHFLADFYDLLEPLGYRLGKLFPNGVDFRPYRLEDEDFMGPNYVAALPSSAALIATPRTAAARGSA
ncbi:MAG: hypothetical protein JWL70_370 [Acidimicrobiia bacterium]|nr:hypothetical protein [Acidimicrobiia bacterium]